MRLRRDIVVVIIIADGPARMIHHRPIMSMAVAITVVVIMTESLADRRLPDAFVPLTLVVVVRPPAKLPLTFFAVPPPPQLSPAV